MNTSDLLESIRSDIKRALREELLADLKPEIEKRLYRNVFSLKEASAYLHISESTLRRMIETQEIPFFRLRGQLFFRQSDLDTHIDLLVSQNAKEARTHDWYSSSTSPLS
ncbi:MAG: helix-turn-helix domain-containing protein [Gorillibacterium sp.]|nr:helix-turn-helix domain-containing protein [Gorillibacterium sp.]